MRSQKALAVMGAVTLLVSSFSTFGAYAAAGDGIKTLDELREALDGTFAGDYRLENNINVTNTGITVSNDGYYVVNENGELKVQNDNGAEIYFDMSARSELHKGSTGFLYGTEEPNGPT